MITGHQWWWEIQYEDADAQPHRHDRQRDPHPGGRAGDHKLESNRRDPQPVGAEPDGQERPDPRPRRTSSACWPPNPGDLSRPMRRVLRAAARPYGHPGVAQSPLRIRALARTAAGQRPAPNNAEQQAGHDAFLKRSCVMCHAIRGTEAGGRCGPDLTHVGSRIDAGSGHAAPHARQPRGLDLRSAQRQARRRHAPHQLDPDELNGVAAYLESLK